MVDEKSSDSVKLVASSKAEPGQSIFTSSGVFNIPRGVTNVDIFAVGGGGNGQSAGGNVGGGGGGYTNTVTGVNVQKNGQIQINVGIGGSYDGSSYKNGGTSSAIFNGNTIVSANGGIQNMGNSGKGGSGGSGGGSARANGGSDGSDGSSVKGGTYWFAGKGQGTTTRAFGEASGTLYAGGGGGSFYVSNTGQQVTPIVGVGGAGGGGNGRATVRNSSTHESTVMQWATDGQYGTGGGGGGGLGIDFDSAGCSGGSGSVIVRWH